MLILFGKLTPFFTAHCNYGYGVEGGYGDPHRGHAGDGSGHGTHYGNGYKKGDGYGHEFGHWSEPDPCTEVWPQLTGR